MSRSIAGNDSTLDRRPTGPAVAGFALAVIGGLALLFSGLGFRWGWWSFRFGFSVLRWGFFIGVAALLLSLLGVFIAGAGRPKARGLAVLGLVLGAVVVVFPLNAYRKARTAPPIHDITTDTANPPQFVAILPLRANADNPSRYGGPEVAAQQTKAFPDIAPAHLNLPVAQAFDRALAAAREMGWEIVAADPAQGRIEATAKTFWFGFKDDVVVRVAPEDNGSRVDVRSVSRVGRGDLGTNAKRIRNFLTNVETSK